jgi:hypothetical protein
VRRPDVFVAKALLVVGAAFAGTLWYFRSDPTVVGEVPFLAMFSFLECDGAWPERRGRERKATWLCQGGSAPRKPA